jgi:hypothetical protein
VPLTVGVDGSEGRDPIHRLYPRTLGERRHPGIGPLGSRDESMRGSELVVDAQRGRAISSSGRANQACRRVVEVLQEEGPDLDLILDLSEDPRRVPKTVHPIQHGADHD